VALGAGLPLWWFLGLGEMIFLVLAVPMLVRLLVTRPLKVPSWFGLWLAFLAIILFSGPLMTAHAPGTLDASLATGTITFTFRLALYVVATVFMLYVVNVSEKEMSTALVGEVLAGIFVVTVAGGIFGVLAPGFEITSLTERLLPAGTNSFIRFLVHPSVSDVESILGYPQPRPKAPFVYANSWGAAFTVTLPFFLWRYFGAHARWWRRLAAIPILFGAVIGVTYSLNRGLWVGIGLAAAVYAVHLIRVRGVVIVPALAALAAVLLFAVASSPLGDVVTTRLENPHSNARRGGMAAVTVASVLEGSPILGFGNTRRLEGSFFSIAGDATPTCPFCAVPPLGTQGHAWLVIFSQGLLGAVLCFGFLVVAGMLLHIRRRDPVAVAGLAAIVPLVFEMWFYDTLGSAFILAMLVIGLLARSSPVPRTVPLERLILALRAGWPRVLVGALIGLSVGVMVLPTRQLSYQAKAEVLVPPNPMYLSTAANRTPKATTLDTESRTALSQPLLDKVRTETRAPDVRFSVAAVPGSKVLVLTGTGPDPSAVRRAANGLAAAVVEAQRERLHDLRASLVKGTEDRIRAITLAQQRASTGSRGVYTTLLLTRQSERDRVARTLLVDAQQLRPAQATRVGKDNDLVPPLSGLAVGVVLGGLAATLRPRTLGRGALRRLAPDVLVLGPGDRHCGPMVRTLIQDRHGPTASVCVATVAASRSDVRWLRRNLEDGGLSGEFRRSSRMDPSEQTARALAHDAVVLVVGRRPSEVDLRRTLALLASVDRSPDVIMVGATRLIAGPRAHWTIA
jgi:hypothetical protein